MGEGQPLRPDETVHHRDGNRSRNAIENLELWASPQPWGQRVSDLVAFVIDQPGHGARRFQPTAGAHVIANSTIADTTTSLLVVWGQDALRAYGESSGPVTSLLKNSLIGATL